MEYAVIGLGRFGSAVAMELEKKGNTVIAIDKDPKKCKDIAKYVSTTLILDATNEEAIREASLDHIDVVIVGMGASDVNASFLACLILKEMGVKTVVAKGISKEHSKILEKIGVDKVVRPELEMGIRLARKLDSGNILDFIDLSEEIRMDGILVRECNVLANRTIFDINLRKNYGINIVCIRRGDQLVIPDSDTIVFSDDILLVVGESSQMDKFEKEVGLKK